MPVVWTESQKRALGGTELAMKKIEERVNPELLEEVQVFVSRVDETLIDPDMPKVLWVQDLAEDPMYRHLEDGGWRRWNKVICVSYTQRAEFMARFSIPPSRCAVIRNAIDPLEFVPREDPDAPVKLIYTPTPHRGLNILLSAFGKLSEQDPGVTLDVYSSFKLYGQPDADLQFAPLFDFMDSHPKITAHGSVSNEEVRRAVSAADVFAYPSTWRETSCMCLIEAMSADLLCVHSDLAALPETAAGWTAMYPLHEDQSKHAGVLLHGLREAVRIVRARTQTMTSQKPYTDMMYDWELRRDEWNAMLQVAVREGPIRSVSEEFTYDT